MNRIATVVKGYPRLSETFIAQEILGLERRDVPQLIVSPRDPKGPHAVEIAVDPALLAAGDHNGSTFYQHQKFQQAAAGRQQVEVTLTDGWWAVEMGLAAQRSATTGEAVTIDAGLLRNPKAKSPCAA